MPAAPASAEVSDGTEASGITASDGDTLQLALLAGPPPLEPVPESFPERAPDRASKPAPEPAPAAAAKNIAPPTGDSSTGPGVLTPATVKPVALKPAAVTPAKPAAIKPPAMERATARTAQAGAARAEAVPATPARMDRQFIAQNNIVERYLTGRLPPRGVQDFERYCRDHPELLEELRLADHLHAALRLLEAGGQGLPWEDKAPRWWEKLPVLIGTCSLCVVLAALWLGQTARLSAQQRHNAALEQQLAGRPLDPVEFTRAVRIIPDVRGPSQQSIATIGGDRAELADLTIDLSRSRYRAFNVTIDRVGQGRVAILHNLVRDSNGNLRIELNSSTLGPGDYRLSIDGLTWSGAPVAQAWATITVARGSEDP